jgi:hypothetical protein
MKTLHKWIILCALLLAAIASYSYGSSQGVVAFILIGVIFELTFWFKLLKKKPHTES